MSKLKLNNRELLLFASCALFALAVYTAVLVMPWVVLRRETFRAETIEEFGRVKEVVGLLGTYGDMFGAANTFFTGLAFAALVYTAQLQRKQVEMQQEEITMLRCEEDKKNARLEISPERWVFRKSFRPDDLSRHTKHARLTMYGKVTNMKATAIDCRAYLARFDHEDGSEPPQLKPADWLVDPIRLQWAIEDEEQLAHKGINLPNGFSAHFRLVMSERLKDFPLAHPKRILQLALGETKTKDVFDGIANGKKYRATVLIVAENSPPVSMTVEFRFGEDLSDPEYFDDKLPNSVPLL